jgi:polysaccharide chain length determinant protein (PEP-CTERM system associated)
VTENLFVRLSTMQEQILSRTRLQPLIERFGLFQGETDKVPMEELVERMREAVVVTPLRSGGADDAPISGFTISFTYANARLAQQVCSEITSMFIDENLRSRQQSAQGTTDFLRKQLQGAKDKLDEQDSKLAAFKGRYSGQLPDQAQTNVNMLMQLNSQLESITQSLDRNLQDKAFVERTLAQQLSVWNSQHTAADRPDALNQQLSDLEAQLVAAERRYTNSHPDVIRLKSAVAALKERVTSSRRIEKQPQVGPDDNAEQILEPASIQQVRSQLNQLDGNIAERTREQQRIKGAIQTYESRIQLSPSIEEQYKELTRDYNTALDFYNDLLKKQTQSEMATDLEKRQEGEQFRVVDPANLPVQPSYPDRANFVMYGLIAGAAIGAGLTALLEFRDRSLTTGRDVEALLRMPVLAVLPDLNGAPASMGGHNPPEKKRFWPKAAGA